MMKNEPRAGARCPCGSDLFDCCDKCHRWGCYRCEFRPHGSRERALCLETCSTLRSEPMPKKPKKDGDRKPKSKAVSDLSTKSPKVKQPNPKGKRAPAPEAKAVCQPKTDLSTKLARPQSELFPVEKRPQPRKVEDPVVDPAAAAPPQPPAPLIAKDIAYPPETAFTAPFVEGSLAHHLMQPEARVDRVVENKFRQVRYPWVSEWTGAADAGDPCIRKLVYQRLHPEAALPDEGEFAFLFKHGTWVEKEVLDEMAQAGYEVVEQQRPFHDEDLKVKGKIDGKLMLHHGGKRKRPPFEVKGYAPSIWERINSARDMLDANAGYLKKVPAQVTLYLVLDKDQDADAALLYMKNKVTGKPKSVVVPRDAAYVDWLLGRLKLVRQFVLQKELPPRIEFEESSCGKCPFCGVCLKDMPAGPNPLVLDPEKAAMLLELLELWWGTNEQRKVWKEVDDKIAAIVRNHPKIIVGDFIVTGTPGSQKRIDEGLMTPDELKKFKRDFPTWRKGIVNVKDLKGSGVAE